MSQPTNHPRPRTPVSRLGLFLLAGLVGVLVGLGVFTFRYAEGASYLSDNPNTCMNCHIMRPEFDGWNHSSHKAVATCNGCHTPHTFVRKWMVKGLNGLRHSYAFTTGNFPEPIRITEFNARVAQENCVACHQAFVSEIHKTSEGEERFCTSCHSHVGHDS